MRWILLMGAFVQTQAIASPPPRVIADTTDKQHTYQVAKLCFEFLEHSDPLKAMALYERDNRLTFDEGRRLALDCQLVMWGWQLGAKR